MFVMETQTELNMQTKMQTKMLQIIIKITKSKQSKETPTIWKDIYWTWVKQ